MVCIIIIIICIIITCIVIVMTTIKMVILLIIMSTTTTTATATTTATGLYGPCDTLIQYEVTCLHDKVGPHEIQCLLMTHTTRVVTTHDVCYLYQVCEDGGDRKIMYSRCFLRDCVLGESGIVTEEN